MYTPLHRALGRGPSPLTHELLEACVAAGVPESESLDWKQTLPHQTGGPRWAEEWAKDVAAMANTAGGCIVYGVVEDPGSGAAAALVDVGPLGDDVESRLRQSAAAQISPLVARLQFIPVVSNDGQSRALVVRVPNSPDVPHLLRDGKEGGFRAPHRYGATTEWMSDRDLEAAYRRRFRRTSELEELLGRRYGAAERHAAHLSGIQQAWVVAAAVPLDAQAEIELTHEAAAERLATAHDLYRALHGRPVDRYVYDLSTAPGLRRLIAGGPHNRYQIELHFDGGVTLIEQLDDAAPAGHVGGVVAPTDEIEASIARLVATLAATARATGEATTYAAQVGLVWRQPNGGPLHLGRPHPMMIGREYRVLDRPLHEVETSVREVRAGEDVAGLRATARTLALDLLRQGGAADTTFIPAED